MSVVTEVGRVRAAAGGGRYIVETIPVGSSASNGIVERAIRSVQQQVRVMRSAVEERTGAKLTPRHPIMTWMVENANYLLNRYEVGHDGKTAYERCKGKVAKVLGIEFGEAVLWKRRAVGGALAKMTCLWEDGVYLGLKGASGEVIVADETGVWKTRSMQRKPLEARWGAAVVDSVKHVPWRVSEDDPEVDGERLTAGEMGLRMPGRDVEMEARTEPSFHRMQIKKSDFEKIGFTTNCQGCKSILRGTARQGHTEACRSRMEAELKGDPRLITQRKREDEFMAKRLEEADGKRRKIEEAAKDDAMHDVSGEGAASSAAATAGASSSSSGGPQKMQRDDMEQDGGGGGGNEKKREGGQEDLAVMLGETKKARIGAIVNQDEDGPEDAIEYMDGKTGEHLDRVLVEEARQEEISYMRRIGLYELCTIEECFRMTGKPPVSTKWVDINKGTAESPEVRCRLVARDFKIKGEGIRDDLFAAMPPLETKRLLFKMAASTWKAKSSDDKWKIMLIDVKKAHLNGVVGEDEWACIELPDGDKLQGMCGRLRRWLYGMRPAARAWEEDYSEKLQSIGFVRGKAAPTIFRHPVWNVRCVVHGDDFTIVGPEKCLKDVKAAMEEWYVITMKGILGPDPQDADKLVILNRILMVEEGVLTYAPDPKHVKLLCEGMGLKEESKGLESPVAKEEKRNEDENDDLMEPQDASRFRALAARANYVALDRVDVQFAAKEVCREMAAPKQSSWLRLKRLARYLLQYPDFRWLYPFGHEFNADVVQVFSDSDWAGCRSSRKSTSGGVLVVDGCCLRGWSSTQSTVATSSGEA